jgi:hypothetical protein
VENAMGYLIKVIIAEVAVAIAIVEVVVEVEIDPAVY